MVGGLSNCLVDSGRRPRVASGSAENSGDLTGTLLASLGKTKSTPEIQDIPQTGLTLTIERKEGYMLWSDVLAQILEGLSVFV